MMVDQTGYGYLHERSRPSDNRIVWKCRFYSRGSKHKCSAKCAYRCSNSKCPARAWTVDTKITKLIGEHNHPPDDDLGISTIQKTENNLNDKNTAGNDLNLTTE